jgi:hypothetical protein
MQQALVVASRLSALSALAPGSSFFTGSAIFLPDGVRVMAVTPTIALGTIGSTPSFRLLAKNAEPAPKALTPVATE